MTVPVFGFLLATTHFLNYLKSYHTPTIGSGGKNNRGIWHYSDGSQKRSNVWAYVSRIERGRGGMENTFAWLSGIAIGPL